VKKAVPSHKKPPRKMKNRSGWGEKIVIVVILLVIVWAIYSFSQPTPAVTPTTTPTAITTTNSGMAPDFTLPVVGSSGLTGQRVSLSSFRGKVVLLEFMVPSCSHCQDMVPILERLYNQFGQQNVVFLSVSGAWNGESANDAAQFMQTYHATWTFLYDSSNSVFNTYGVDATPTFFIVGKDGRFATTLPVGTLSYETLAAELTRANS
jgi:peroxiredoxin